MFWLEQRGIFSHSLTRAALNGPQSRDREGADLGAAHLRTCCGRKVRRTSIVEEDIEQRAVNFQPAVVVDEAQFAEPVHEEVDP